MIRKISVFLGILFIFTACSVNKNIVQPEVENGMDSFKAGDYNKALAEFENKITVAEQKGEHAAVMDYEGAGKSAYALDLKDKALNYLDIARNMNSHDSEVYFELADIYRLKNNISKEIRYLEFYNSNYPDGSHLKDIRVRLFEAYVETESWEQGLALWPEVKDNVQSHSVLIDGYFKINKALKNDVECDKIAKEILKLNPDHVGALEWTAERYFWEAENLYQKEMAAYNKKKTNSQYAKLLKALDVVTVDFKRSRDYFEKLFKINPLSQYARFLANIYARLDDKEKAKFYRSKVA